tara:strand:- start:94 stop:264 length:171 start_codon:yes stop_codon:yes gene_type:complete
MGEVFQFKTKKELSDFSMNGYEVDEFTITWENLGLSFQGTIQIQNILDSLEEESIA